MTAEVLQDGLETVGLLYAQDKDRERDEADGVTGYRAIREILVGSSYAMQFHENLATLYEEKDCNTTVMKLLLWLQSQMKAGNLWRGRVEDFQDRYGLSRSTVHKAFKFLKDRNYVQEVAVINGKRTSGSQGKLYMISVDICWKGKPGLMARAPKGLRFAGKNSDWLRWQSPRVRAQEPYSLWWEDIEGIWWKLQKESV